MPIGWTNPAQVAADSLGNLYIADTANNRLVKLNSTATLVGSITGLTGITGVTLDGSDNIYVADPRFFPTGHASPQPFLAPLEATAWHPAQRLGPYRSRCPRSSAEQQAALPEPDCETASG
jgi:DNA-binding beta-propeller fold protein YncE